VLLISQDLGCNRFSDLVQSRYHDTADVLQDFIACHRFSTSIEETHSRSRRHTPGLLPTSPTDPNMHFHCKLCPAPGGVPKDISLSCIRLPAPPVMQLLFRKLTGAGTGSRTFSRAITSRNTRAARSSLKPYGCYVQAHFKLSTTSSLSDNAVTATTYLQRCLIRTLLDFIMILCH
jgi:hypothetical protein